MASRDSVYGGDLYPLDVGVSGRCGEGSGRGDRSGGDTGLNLTVIITRSLLPWSCTVHIVGENTHTEWQCS